MQESNESEFLEMTWPYFFVVLAQVVIACLVLTIPLTILVSFVSRGMYSGERLLLEDKERARNLLAEKIQPIKFHSNETYP